MRHANGEWRYILDRGQISGRDADGRPIRFTGTHFDLTSRERDRQRIADHQRELSDLVAAIPSALAVFDRDLRYVAASDAWLREFALHRPIIGRRLDVPDQSLWMSRLRRALAGEELREDEQPVPVGPEHAPRWRSLVVMPWRRGAGDIDGVLVRIDDVTDLVVARRARERQRESRMQMLAMFAGGVAHEINSPLQVIGIEAHLIATALDGDDASIDELRKSARSIREMASRAMAITRALRTLSRDPHGDPVEPVELASVCEQACVLVQARFRAAGVRLDRADVDADLRAMSRPSELLHVLVNLLDNAQDAARQGEPWVRLEVEADGDEVALRCVDGGVGVPPHLQPRLGEPFVTDKPSGQGTGLGLSIVKLLVERSGGSLHYLAAADHTTFEVRFPRAERGSA